MALHGGQPAIETSIQGTLPEGVKFDSWKDALETTFPELDLVNAEVRPRDNVYEYHYATPMCGVRCSFDGDVKVSCNIYCSDAKLLTHLKDFFEKTTTKDIPKGRVHALVSTHDGLQFQSLGIGSLALERLNYEQEVLDGYDRICSELKSPTPGGRIAIIDGPPGGGKTFLVRGLLATVTDVVFAIIPANLVHSLAEPQIVPLLVGLRKNNGNKPLVFIIEDADECLAPRMADNMSSVSAVLNLGDGILGQLLDVRIVATTNTHHQEIDSAIRRPGRLSAIVHVGFLSVAKANEIYLRLTGKEGSFDRKATLAEVYRHARDDGWKPDSSEKKVGFDVD
jgi:hypothetical protein